MLITTIAVLVTWYASKVYYTKTTLVKISKLDTKGFLQAKCSKCSNVVTIHKDNLRVPFYCSSCK